MKNRLMLILLVIFFVANSYSGQSGAISVNTAKFQIITKGTPRAFIYDIPISGETCIDNNTSVILFDPAGGYYLGKELYATLLTAKTTGKMVNITTSGCWDAAGSSYPVVNSVYIMD